MLICYQPTAETLLCQSSRLLTVEKEAVSSEDAIRLKC